MPLAYWCILIAALMPYGLAPLARKGGIGNKTPRQDYAKLEGRPARALAAHQNSQEVFPFFAAAVILAMMIGTNPFVLDALAVFWVVTRAVYAWAYLADKDKIRSVVFLAGLLTVIAIFTSPLWS